MWSECKDPMPDEKGREGREVVVVDERVPTEVPAIASLTVNKSSRVHIGTKNINVTQNVHNNDVIKDLSLPRYLWNVLKNTTRAERLACLAAIILVLTCNALIIYFTIFAKQPEPVDPAPHEWNITREMWLARPFTHTSTEFAPLRLVIIQHTVSTECHTFVTCAAEMRNLQDSFIDGLGYDIPYNFGVGNDGRIYELRGWGVVGAHTRGYNLCSMGIGFVGDYRGEKEGHAQVTKAQLNRTLMLLDYGVQHGHLHPKYHVIAAKDITATASPGSNLYEALQKLEHFDHNASRFRDMPCEDIYAILKVTDV